MAVAGPTSGHVRRSGTLPAAGPGAGDIEEEDRQQRSVAGEDRF